jgi:hypothetical protein
METNNPELQEKLQELEHELEVSRLVSQGRGRVLGLSRARVALCYDPNGMLGMDTNL